MTSEDQNREAPQWACSRAGEEKRTADRRGGWGHIFLGGFKGYDPTIGRNLSLTPSFFCLIVLEN